MGAYSAHYGTMTIKSLLIAHWKCYRLSNTAGIHSPYRTADLLALVSKETEAVVVYRSRIVYGEQSP